MIALREDEKILMTVHRHWIIIFSRLCFLLLLGTLPFFVFLVLSFSEINMQESASIYFLVLLLAALWWLILLFIFFETWLDYWLDAWIITNVRVISIDQIGLFRRVYSEIPATRIQDVSIETNGMLATFLGYGNIRIQTAGEDGFHGRTMPNLNEVKNCLMEHSVKTSKS